MPGNNLGIRSTEAEFYVLLNGDTLVSDHWLDRLLAFAREHPEAGLMGPVSNAVGNEQILYLPYAETAAIFAAGREYADRQKGSYFYTSMLGFFCAMIRKEVFDRIGLLDERFGLGHFEDNDFCLRAQAAGFKVACLEHVFVYHKGSACFGRVDTTELVAQEPPLLRGETRPKDPHFLSLGSVPRLSGIVRALDRRRQLAVVDGADGEPIEGHALFRFGMFRLARHEQTGESRPRENRHQRRAG